ncbi:pitrilysin family protein [Pelomonas sp. SE-A7]|uniref:M16 family metallopeptidase n=1 Tax=Pelomonas sp. SE-A7 TaxID=3054953 RepID=UPI00259C7306|nr:pitrilysin family protein [Pelomonas sp. SE-A7]MDM4766252.1 pitrilysin family protein [Pelomonas sp. SE-A7]
MKIQHKFASKTLLALAAALALSATVQAAQVKLPAELPAFGQDKPIPVPKIAKKTLANGLEVWVVPRNGLPRVDYVLGVRGAGYGADSATQSGLAGMLANVLNEGTAKRDSRAIAEAAQGLGGEIGAGAGNDGITVFANAVASNAPAMLQLLAEVARTPAYPDREVALAKANALQSLKASEANPGYRAERAMGFVVFGDHAYARIRATADSINATTPELLRAEHARRFRPERSLLVVTGRVNAEQLFKQIEAAFGDWKATGEAPAAVPHTQANAAVQRLLLERPGSVQSTVRLGRPGNDAGAADQVPLRLASTILGGGFSSRVNLNLREEKGYTYGASAGARSYRDGGAIIGGADVRNEVTGAALKEFFSEYKRLGTDLVGADEMAMNKRYVAGGYLISTQLQGAVARTLANNWLIGLPSEFLGNYVPMIQKVTAEQVRDTARKYFDPATQSIVVVGDKAAVSEQLKEFGEFTVQGK